MVSLLDVLAAVYVVKDDLVAGRPIDAWEHSFPLQQFGIDAARAAGLKGTAEDAETRQKIVDALRECEQLCTKGSLKSGSTGAWGDGHILQLVIQLITTLLPLIL
jgi:hypothetical protein